MNLKIYDVRAICDDGRYRRVDDDKREGIAIHHFGVPEITDARGIAEFYSRNEKWTGGQMPYAVVVGAGGRIELALPLDEYGPHARRWSVPMLSVCFIGNFEESPPDHDQWYAGVDVLTELCASMGVVNLKRHDELKGGSKHRDKICPGTKFDVGELSALVSAQIKENALRRFHDSLVAA